MNYYISIVVKTVYRAKIKYSTSHTCEVQKLSLIGQNTGITIKKLLKFLDTFDDPDNKYIAIEGDNLVVYNSVAECLDNISFDTEDE